MQGLLLKPGMSQVVAWGDGNPAEARRPSPDMSNHPRIRTVPTRCYRNLAVELRARAPWRATRTGDHKLASVDLVTPDSVDKLLNSLLPNGFDRFLDHRVSAFA